MALTDALSVRRLETDQRDRFSETARQLGADEDEAAFKAKLAVIARQKVKDEAEVPEDDSKP